MKNRKRKAYVFKPALDDATLRDKGVVVSAQRMRWKERHEGILSEPMMRMLRFVWMRQPFPWSRRNALHAWVLGALMRGGYVEHRSRGVVDEVRVTPAGEDVLNHDRKHRAPLRVVHGGRK